MCICVWDYFSKQFLIILKKNIYNNSCVTNNLIMVIINTLYDSIFL